MRLRQGSHSDGEDKAEKPRKTKDKSKTSAVKISNDTYEKYLASVDKKEVPSIIEAALQMYFLAQMDEKING